ncbi:hypothetical protein L209DRAFT_740626 [Thermothelomyces heterothallicus CBS 203.75]
MGHNEGPTRGSGHRRARAPREFDQAALRRRMDATARRGLQKAMRSLETCSWYITGRHAGLAGTSCGFFTQRSEESAKAIHKWAGQRVVVALTWIGKQRRCQPSPAGFASHGSCGH